MADPLETAPEVKTFGKANQVKITTKFMIDEKGSDELVNGKLNEGLKTLGINYEIMSSQLVGPTIEMTLNNQLYGQSCFHWLLSLCIF